MIYQIWKITTQWYTKPTDTLNVNVAFNNCFRKFFEIKHDQGKTSISSVFCNFSIDNFKVMLRKSIVGFMKRLHCCDNKLVKTICDSTYFIWSSELFSKWQSLAFNLKNCWMLYCDTVVYMYIFSMFYG